VLDPAPRTRLAVLVGAVVAGVIVLAVIRWWQQRRQRLA